MQDFVHLHVHSQYSLLEGSITLDKLCRQTKEYGMSSVAMTDSANLFGGVEFYEKALSYGIKPIFGAEVYYLTGGDLKSRDVKRKDHFLATLVLLVQDLQGYRNLCQLLSIAYLEGFYYKPRLDKETLKKYSKGLIALSGTIHGEIHRRLIRGEEDQAVEEGIGFLSQAFPERFYLEIQDHHLVPEKKIREPLLTLAEKHHVPLVATNNCKYLYASEHEAHLVLSCIQTGRTLHEEEERAEIVTNQEYFKSPQEMINSFKDIPQAIENTIKISNQCNFGFHDKSYHFPKFCPEGNLSLEEYFRCEAMQGFRQRWKEITSSAGEDPQATEKKYLDRLEYELGMIIKMGFSGYFLIVADFIGFAKSKKIPVGPGRGSAAGSLVAYCLKITDIDPIPYDLLFERFLNPERVSMPDMDIDFCMNGRDEVIRYVSEKYGYVSQIITFGSMKAKAVIRDVGRVLDMPYSEVDRIAKLIPNTPNITLAEAIIQEGRLQEMQEKDGRVKRLIEIARSLEGLPRHASMHAAGVVIADRPLTDFCPLYKGPNNEVVAQYDMKSIEKVGLVKFDFLGLKTLTVIDIALKIIKRTRNIDLDMSEVSRNDPKVYETLSAGDAMGIFQLESSGMRDLLVRLIPNCFEDIIALVALYRPGPLGSGMVDDFINRKHGRKKITYEVKELEEVLHSTYGVILYQEQVMKIASLLANFSLGDADLLRRAMGKKKPEEMAKQKAKFLHGAEQKNIVRSKAEKIFDLMAKFAEYGFNKSHSAAYALVSYYTAYLKTHYTVEYMASVLTHEMGNTDKILVYINDCREHKIAILPADVNESFRYFSVVGENEIRFGLAAVKGVGEAAITAIIEGRKSGEKFSSIFDFCVRVDLRRVNKKVMESLIKCGAFDSLHSERSCLMAVLDTAMEWGSKRQTDMQMGQTTMFDFLPNGSSTPTMPKVAAWSEEEKLAFEKQALGFYITGHPMEKYRDQIRCLASFDTQSCTQALDKAEIGICGMVTTKKEITTKKGARMAFVGLEDLVGTVEVVIFSDLYTQVSHLLSGDLPIYVKGHISHTEDSVKILASEIMSLQELKLRKTRAVHLKVQRELMNQDALNELKALLQKYPGTLPTYLHLVDSSDRETVLALPPDLEVTLSEKFTCDIERLLGSSALILH